MIYIRIIFCFYAKKVPGLEGLFLADFAALILK